MNKQPLQKRPGFPFLMGGGIMLAVDMFLWGSMYVLSLLLQHNNGTVFASFIGGILSGIMMLIFLFGFPLIFVGVLSALIGLAIIFIPVSSSGPRLIISGVLTLVVGMLAWIIPSMLVPPESGDTLMAWMAGLTALFVGLPLPLLGIGLLVAGLILVVRRRFSSTSAHQGAKL